MLSFIIPTLNEEKYIEPLLRSIKPQMTGNDEIIVVDSNSADKTVSIAEKYGAQVLQQPKNGIGLAKTAGAKTAKNDIFVFMDADCVPCKGFAEGIRRHFSNPKVVAVGGLDLYHSDSKMWGVLYNAFSKGVFRSAQLMHSITGKYWIAANNCAFRRELFFSVGGYRSVICEDTDLMKRLPPSRGIVYDSSMILTLSDRRFRQQGFFRTLGLWGWSNMAALVGKGASTSGYRRD
ncbi:MAG: glycosyltransferase [Candidatus Aenigmarchaeota archaeon]|nr:glycosyltransferase [Candidatus Aenigmarchaeota archaeon]